MIFAEALAASGVEAAFARKLISGEIDGARSLAFRGEARLQTIPLGSLRRVRIIAAGKASAEMLRSLLTCLLPLPPSCSLEGVLIARRQPDDLPHGFQFFEGSHPLPTASSFAGARAALDLLHSLPAAGDPAETLCLFLISGGASSMMELPLDPSISLSDTIVFHAALVHSGASITEMNCVRKHFSAVKGGRLALAANQHACLSLLVSDVPPAQLDALASGPTLPDTSTVAQCREILTRYHLLPRFPPAIRDFFESPALPETPKAFDLHAHAWTMLDSSDLAATAATAATRLGFHTVIDNTPDDWDYRDAAEYLLERLHRLRAEFGRVCLLSGGEVAVQVPPVSHAHAAPSPAPETTHSKPPSPTHSATPSPTYSPTPVPAPSPTPGKGGRNQHFALYLATLLRPSDAPIAILSAGSDGIDGNSEATGAVVDHNTLTIDPASAEAARSALARFDSGTFFAEHGAAIVTGATGNNLRDLRIFLAE